MRNIDKDVKVKNFIINNNKPFTIIAGPCVIENRDHALKTANKIKDICSSLGLNFIYKSSLGIIPVISWRRNNICIIKRGAKRTWSYNSFNR